MTDVEALALEAIDPEVVEETSSIENQPTQREMPFAVVAGQPMNEFPEDLYIPPDALEVFLEAFEGPLDLLLYLIKRQNVDILDIPITEITRQYMSYIEMMQSMRFELAAEYLVMAAMLAEIKSRLLLPRSDVENEDEADPRAELIRRLQEYECFKKAATDLDDLPRYERDIFPVKVESPEMSQERPLPEVELKDLIMAFKQVLNRASVNASHQIQREPLSIRERMTQVLSHLRRDDFSRFETFFTAEEGRMGVVVTFSAILELVKQSMIELVQNEPFSPIYIKAVGEQT